MLWSNDFVIAFGTFKNEWYMTDKIHHSDTVYVNFKIYALTLVQ